MYREVTVESLNTMKELNKRFRFICYCGNDADERSFYLIDIFDDQDPDPCGDDCRECGRDCPHAEPAKIEALQLALEKAEAALSEMTDARDAVELTLRTVRRNLSEADDRITDLEAKRDELCRDLSAADDRITELEDSGRENEEWRKLGERMKEYLVMMGLSDGQVGKSIYNGICDLLEFGSPAESD